MKVELSVSRWSKLEYVIGSIAATVAGHKIRPNDVIYGSGSNSCYATVAKRLKELDPNLESKDFHIVCFAQPGVEDEPQHCILVRYLPKEILANTWPQARYEPARDLKGTIVGLTFGDERMLVVKDLTAAELRKQYW